MTCLVFQEPLGTFSSSKTVTWVGTSKWLPVNQIFRYVQEVQEMIFYFWAAMEYGKTAKKVRQ